MDQKTLEGFLLATVQESWEDWYGTTRLIFADFLDESAKESEARLLREMTVEIADEWDTEGRAVVRLQTESIASAVNPFAIHPVTFQLARVNEGFLYPLLQETISPLASFHWRSEQSSAIVSQRLRFSILDEFPPDASMPYAIGCRPNEGEWRGTLSLDRARARWRRTIADLFPKARDNALQHFRGWIVDESPRWIPTVTLNLDLISADFGRTSNFAFPPMNAANMSVRFETHTTEDGE